MAMRLLLWVSMLGACGGTSGEPAARNSDRVAGSEPTPSPAAQAARVPAELPPDGCPEDDSLTSWIVVQSPERGATVGDTIELVGRCSQIFEGTVSWRTDMSGAIASGAFDTGCAECVATFQVSLPAPRARGEYFTLEVFETEQDEAGTESHAVTLGLRTAPDH